MKGSVHTLGQKLVEGLLLSPLVLITLPLGAIAAAPPQPIGCPDGWVPRPQNVNPQLGPCMPGTLTTPQQPPYGKLKKTAPTGQDFEAVPTATA